MKQIMLLLWLIFPALLQAQQGVVSTGGDATGTGDTISISCGQTDYLSFSSEEAGSMRFGLLQVFYHFMLFAWRGNDCTDWMVVLNWYPEQVPLEGHDIINPSAQGFWIQVADPENSLIISAASRIQRGQPWYKHH